MSSITELTEFMDDPNAVMDVDKLTEILETGIAETQNGRSTLASLFVTSHFTLIKELHQYLKNHILFLNKSKVLSVGQIYFKAWKTAEEGRQKELEDICIQDLIRSALLTKRQVAELCLEVLRPFLQKELQDVKGMMYKLAQPLIWRTLKAANSEVRFNAIALFLLMFPLRDINGSHQDQLELVERQWESLNACLFDEMEANRVKAITGVGDIMTLYWDAILAGDLNRLFNAFIKKLAWDINSVNVRVAVYKALTAIATNPLSHQALNVFLPKLAMGIHDRSESVRTVVVNLLVSVAKFPTMKLWNIVPFEQIVHRLAAESSPLISERIVGLIFGSFFPEDGSLCVRLERTYNLLRINMVAARNFYQHAAKLTTIPIAVDQILLFLRCVYSLIRRADNGERSRNTTRDIVTSSDDSQSESDVPPMENNDKENEDGSPIKVTDTAMLIGLLDCAAILWTSIMPHLAEKQNEDSNKLLRKVSAPLIMRCVKYFEEETSVMNSILVLIGLLSKDGRYLSNSLIKKVKLIEDGGFDPRVHGNLAETMCFLQLTEIVRLVSKWWQNFDSSISIIGNTTPPPTRPKRVRISVPEAVEISKPRLGIQVISYLINREGTTKKYIMGSYVDQLRELENELQKPWERCMSLAGNQCFDAYWTGEVLKLRSTLVCLICDTDGGSVEALKFLASFMDLVRLNVWPVYIQLAEMNENGENERVELAKAILQTSFLIWKDFILCGLCDEKAILMATDYTKMILDNGSDETFNDETAQLIYHILDYIKYHGLSTEAAKQLRPWSKQIVAFLDKNKDPFDGIDDVKRLVDRFVTALAGFSD